MHVVDVLHDHNVVSLQSLTTTHVSWSTWYTACDNMHSAWVSLGLLCFLRVTRIQPDPAAAVGLVVVHGKKQNRPSNTQEPTQRSTQQMTTARSSAELMSEPTNVHGGNMGG